MRYLFIIFLALLTCVPVVAQKRAVKTKKAVPSKTEYILIPDDIDVITETKQRRIKLYKGEIFEVHQRLKGRDSILIEYGAELKIKLGTDQCDIYEKPVFAGVKADVVRETPGDSITVEDKTLKKDTLYIYGLPNGQIVKLYKDDTAITLPGEKFDSTFRLALSAGTVSKVFERNQYFRPDKSKAEIIELRGKIDRLEMDTVGVYQRANERANDMEASLPVYFPRFLLNDVYLCLLLLLAFLLGMIIGGIIPLPFFTKKNGEVPKNTPPDVPHTPPDKKEELPSATTDSSKYVVKNYDLFLQKFHPFTNEMKVAKNKASAYLDKLIKDSSTDKEQTVYEVIRAKYATAAQGWSRDSERWKNIMQDLQKGEGLVKDATLLEDIKNIGAEEEKIRIMNICILNEWLVKHLSALFILLEELRVAKIITLDAPESHDMYTSIQKLKDYLEDKHEIRVQYVPMFTDYKQYREVGLTVMAQAPSSNYMDPVYEKLPTDHIYEIIYYGISNDLIVASDAQKTQVLIKSASSN